jgi:hypothetical protein
VGPTTKGDQMRFLPKSDPLRGHGIRPWHLALLTALLAALAIPAMAIGGAGKVKSTTFPLFVNGANLNCLAAPGKTPTATATVKRGKVNDSLTLTMSGFKPGLDFDLFTVER